MNCESWLEPKNSLMEATIGRMLMSDCGVISSTSCVVMRSRTTRSMRARPIRNWFWISSPTLRMRRLPKWSMSSIVVAVGGLPQLDQVADGGQDVLVRQRGLLVGQLEAELLVDLVAADLREVVALRVEEQAVEQRTGRLDRRRLARTQALVDLDERLFARLGEVLLERALDALGVVEHLEDLLARLGDAEGLEEHRRPAACACGRRGPRRCLGGRSQARARHRGPG